MQAGLTSLIEENKKIKDQLKVFKSYSYIGFKKGTSNYYIRWWSNIKKGNFCK